MNWYLTSREGRHQVSHFVARQYRAMSKNRIKRARQHWEDLKYLYDHWAIAKNACLWVMQHNDLMSLKDLRASNEFGNLIGVLYGLHGESVFRSRDDLRNALCDLLSGSGVELDTRIIGFIHLKSVCKL